jgi:putative ABC transport system permease protein
MIFENLRIALSGLRANRMRSALTMLGILIGTMSVILLLAVGAGAQRYIQRQVSDLGSNTVFVSPILETDAFGNVIQGGTRSRKPAITDADVRALRDESTAIDQLVPTVGAGVTATAGTRTLSIGTFTGTTAEYPEVLPTQIVAGSFFTDADVDQRRRVAVVGDTVARRLYPGQPAVGQRIVFNGSAYEVIGVLKKRGASLIGDLDNQVIAPITSVQDTLTGRVESYSQLIITPRSAGVAAAAAEEARAILRAEHRIPEPPPGEPWKDDFDLFDSKQFTDTTNQISRIFTILLGGIAGISLLVGGIGVMNIMLVTVTERTREIGIRKAVGARRGNLLGQFLFESVVLACLGGAVGIGLGVALSQISAAGFEPVVQPYSIALGFGVSVFTGVFFGLYPANRAAKLRPIDALRYE